MSAPLCPKMLHLLPSRYREHITSEGMASQHWDGHASEDDCRCRGSGCALWVLEARSEPCPEMLRPQSMVYINQNGDRVDVSGRGWSATGRGWCADNLRRQPWTDPAADNDNTSRSDA